MRLIRLFFVFLTVVAVNLCQAAAFPEHSQPAGGGGFRNDTKGAGYSPHGTRFDAIIAASDHAYYGAKYDESLEIINAVFGLDLTPEQKASALTHRGITKGMLELNDGALKDFDEAIKLKPNLSTAYANRARIFIKMRRYDEAATDINRAIALSPNNFEAYEYRADLYDREHRWNDALAAADKAVAIFPKEGYIRADRALICIRLGRFDEAFADANAALGLRGKAGDAFVARAHVYIHRKQYDEAEKDLQSAAQIYSLGRASNLSNIAWIRATCPVDRMRDGRKAVAMATRACALDHRKEASYIDILAAACAESGDFSSAIKYETEALNAPRPSSETVTREYQQRLALYEKHQPYRDAHSG